MISDTYPETLKRYLHKLSNISTDSLDNILLDISEDFNFIDPFNNTRGKENYKKVLEAAIHDSKDLVFKVHNIKHNDSLAHLSWNYSFIPNNKTLGQDRISIDGMSEIRISESGLIYYHRDYWDVSSCIYERIPVIGFILKKLRQRIAVSNNQ